MKASLALGSAIFTLALLPGVALGQTAFNGTYTWGANGSVSSFAYNGTDIPGLTEGPAVKGSGITSSSSSNNFRGNSWSTTTFDSNDYVGFTLTADEGATFDMTSITFGVGRSGTGPRSWEWRSSVDNFAAPITTYTTLATNFTNTDGVLANPDSDSSWTGNVLDLSGPSYDNLSTVTFRLYGYGAEMSTGTAGLQGPLSFAGTLVPEPSAVMLGALGVLPFLKRRRAA